MIPICGYWDRWWPYHGLKWRPLKHVGSWHGKPRGTKSHQLQVVLASHGVHDLWDSWWRLGSQGPNLKNDGKARLRSTFQPWAVGEQTISQDLAAIATMPGLPKRKAFHSPGLFRWIQRIQHGPLWSYQQNYITLLTVYASPCWCGLWPITLPGRWSGDRTFLSPRYVSGESWGHVSLLGSLEPWNFITFPWYWECHDPNWWSPSFFRGVGWKTTSQHSFIYYKP
jgi:hypothetical protein